MEDGLPKSAAQVIVHIAPRWPRRICIRRMVEKSNHRRFEISQNSRFPVGQKLANGQIGWRKSVETRNLFLPTFLWPTEPWHLPRVLRPKYRWCQFDVSDVRTTCARTGEGIHVGSTIGYHRCPLVDEHGCFRSMVFDGFCRKIICKYANTHTVIIPYLHVKYPYASLLPCEAPAPALTLRDFLLSLPVRRVRQVRSVQAQW